MKSLKSSSPEAKHFSNLKTLLEQRKRRRLESFYPDTGSLCLELYPKYLAFFRAGKTHRERAFIAANKN